MQIDPLARRVRLSVGTLANFRSQASSGGTSGVLWRAPVGQQWHHQSASQTLAQFPEARFEESIAGTLLHADWTFHLQGRIDQVIPCEGKLILREVKTIQRPLPIAPEELAVEYPGYFAQAAIYLGLARILPEYNEFDLRAELQYISIQDGTAQIVPLEPADEALPEARLDQLVRFLEDRRNCIVRFNEATIRPAFETLRTGQKEFIDRLQSVSLRSPFVLAQAPTGFGKTGIVLQHALGQMQDGLFERCLYLTSKSTGQLETVRQLKHMVGGNLRYIQMRNRNEHRIDSPKHSCKSERHCKEELDQHFQEAGIYPPELFVDGTFNLQSAKRIGSETGICPYNLTKACLPYAAVWIGDSNYLFAPSSRHVFMEAHGFIPEKTIVIIDEAHNLPSRNSDALSLSLTTTDLLFAIEELRQSGAKRRLLNSLNLLASEIETLPPGKALSADQIYRLYDLSEEAARQLESARFDYQATPDFALETIGLIPEMARRLGEHSSDWLHWSPSAGKLEARCLDASEWTTSCLKNFGSVLFMSATLNPIEHFYTDIGIQAKQASLAIGHADWRDNAYQVAIDCRVDTRFRQRDKHYETTARAIASMIQASPGMPVAAFFPSYQYAENIHAYLSALDPSLRIALQERGLDLPAQEQFIDQALFTADTLFLILGSSYAEGIDKLGGRIESIIVISPALPEVNPIQQAKVNNCSTLSHEAAFEQVYIIPAMRRIKQALGRIVRAPGHRARVLLHCKRFQEASYQIHFEDEYQASAIIRDTASFHKWLTEDPPQSDQ